MIAQRQNDERRQGFALVLSLFLMGFILLLLLSVTTLLRVETASGTGALAQMEAREAAKLALYVAVGELQQAAGPDSRVSARAEILGSSVTAGQRYWTGIWDTENPSTDPVWLVSGANPDPENPSSSNRLTLAGSPSVDLNGASYADQIIEVPAVELPGTNGQPMARIAWWISDEGTKASVSNLPLPSRQNPSFLDAAETDAAELQLGSLQGLEGLFAGYDRFETTAVARQGQIQSIEDLRIFDSFSDPTGLLLAQDLGESPFHSLTPKSTGVLANTLPSSDPDSGLMRDLSLYPELLGDGLAEYLRIGESHEAALAGTDVSGLRLFTELAGIDALPSLSDGDIAMPIAPILTNFMLAFTVRCESPVSANPNFYLRMRFFSEFWNPFTHSLSMVDSSGAEKELELEVEGLPTVTVYKTTGTPASSPPINIQSLLGDSTKPNSPLVIQLDYDPAEDWLPGQSKNWNGVDATLATGTSPYLSIDRVNKLIGDPDQNLGGSTGLDTGVPRLTGDIRHESTGTNEIVVRVFLKDTASGDRELISELDGFAYEPVSTRTDGYSNTHSGATFGYHILLRSPHHSSDDIEFFRGRWLYDHDPRNPLPDLNPDWYLDNDPLVGTGSAYVPIEDGIRPISPPEPNRINETSNTIEISDFRRLHDRSLGSFGASFNRLWQDAPLFELPRQRVLSLAALQHVYFHNERPFQIGNSWGSEGAFNTSSWFDRYYFSGFSRDDDPGAYDDRSGPPNPTLLSYNSIDATQLAAWQTELADDPNAATAPAEQLMVANRFNLNSTSVPAWKAVLGSLRLNGWRYLDYPENDTSDLTDLRVANADREATFTRFSHSLGETYEAPETPAFEGSEPVAPSAYYRHGARRLTDTQLEALAREIVRLLQARAEPFMNMESFLSADPSGNSLLENAIAAVLSTAGRQRWYHDWELSGDAGAIDGTNYLEIDHFSPGFLTQADILTAIGPMLATRSDTFKIRARAQTLNALGGTSGDAMLEAVVQRTPEVYLPGTGSSLVSRKFKIVSLRWLDTSEI